MLDEPFAGIDPKTVAEIQDQIRSLVETYNIGILLTDHNIRETLEVTDRSYVIREGQVFAYGDRLAILNNPDVRKHYIGDRFDIGHLQDKRHIHALGDAQSESSPVVAGNEPHVADEANAEAYPAVNLSLPAPEPSKSEWNAANSASGLDVALDDLARRSIEDDPPVPEREPTPAPPPIDPLDDFERSFGTTITVLGDVVIEKVDLEVQPPPIPPPSREKRIE